MKKAMRVFLLAVIVVVAMSVMVQAGQEKSQASLEETLEWIESKIVGQTGRNIFGGTFENENCRNEFVYNGCSIRYSAFGSTKLDGAGDMPNSNVYSVDLKNVLKIGSKEGRISLETKRGKVTRVASWHVYKYGTTNGKRNTVLSSQPPELESTVDINLPKDSDVTLQDRLVKAFTHAANLCGGGPANQKKEPF